MDNRSFNSVMHFFNERWAARALGMKVNPERGPDLIDAEKVMEVKFKVLYPNMYMHISWRTLEHQMDYGQEHEAYWGLGTYLMKKRVSEIEARDIRELERLVLKRTLAVVPWQWMNQFQSYRQVGKTKLSEWDNTIRFPKGRLLPRTIETYAVRGGEVYITEGVDSKRFNISASQDSASSSLKTI